MSTEPAAHDEHAGSEHRIEPAPFALPKWAPLLSGIIGVSGLVIMILLVR